MRDPRFRKLWKHVVVGTELLLPDPGDVSPFCLYSKISRRKNQDS